jgi:hypothetical protein
MICDFFDFNFQESEDEYEATIEYVEEGEKINSIGIKADGIRTYIYHLKEEEKFVFKSTYAFFDGIKSDATISKIFELSKYTVNDMMVFDDAKEYCRIPLAHTHVYCDFFNGKELSYNINLELSGSPEYSNYTDLIYQLFDFWKRFQYLASEFNTNLVINNRELKLSLFNSNESIDRLMQY